MRTLWPFLGMLDTEQGWNRFQTDHETWGGERENRQDPIGSQVPETSTEQIILSHPVPKFLNLGETNPKIIQKNTQEAINGRYSLFCLGFGFDVNYPFLEKLALDNGGLARRIYEDSDSALQLQVLVGSGGCRQPGRPCLPGVCRIFHPPPATL